MRIIKAIYSLLSKKDFLIFLLSEITIILLLMSSLFFRDIAYNKIKMIKTMIDNLDWFVSPLSEIKFFPKDEKSCPSEYENFLNYNGNTVIDNVYCVCPQPGLAEDENKKKQKRFCDQVEKARGCSDSYSRFPELSFLKGKKICVKRNYDLNYSKMRKFVFAKEENCAENLLKNCGKIDSKENKLCLMQNQSCPINSVVFGRKKNFSEKDLSLLKKLSLNEADLYSEFNSTNVNIRKNIDTKIIEFGADGDLFLLVSNSTVNNFEEKGLLDFENKEFMQELSEKRIISFLRLEKDFPCVDYRICLRQSNNKYFGNQIDERFFCDENDHSNKINLFSFWNITSFNFLADIVSENQGFGILNDFALENFNDSITLFAKNYNIDFKIPKDSKGLEYFTENMNYFLESFNRNFLAPLIMIFSTIILAFSILIIWAIGILGCFPMKFVYGINVIFSFFFCFLFFSEYIKKYYGYYCSLRELAYLSDEEKMNLAIRDEFDSLFCFAMFEVFILVCMGIKVVVYLTMLIRKEEKMKTE